MNETTWMVVVAENRKAPDCQGCGLCCKHLIVELCCRDVEREPQLAAVSRLFRDCQSEPCGIDPSSGEMVHDDPCRYVPYGPCPMLQEDGRCSIYSTRPSVCREFRRGGTRCRDLREAYRGDGP